MCDLLRLRNLYYHDQELLYASNLTEHVCMQTSNYTLASLYKMDQRGTVPLVPLHLTSLAILSPTNKPLFVHSFTSKSDELRHYHLSHAAVDVVEERSELILWAGCTGNG